MKHGILTCLCTTALLIAAEVTVQSAAHAQTFSVLYNFAGPDGGNPQASLLGDAAGNLYGTTYGGGAFGSGTLFKLDTSTTHKLTELYMFTGGADGGFPQARLIRDAAGNLYGTTVGGGNFQAGTVFKVTPAGIESVLYSFAVRHGSYPAASLVRDAAGNLYGTTYNGGAFGLGVVFELDTTGIETVLHSFTGGPDGANPYGSLIRDTAGNLYGTTLQGGTSNLGVLFKLDTAGTLTVLHSFTGPDGANPLASLVRDAAGNLYGTTVYGGASNNGTVFKLDTAGSETVLHSFAGPDGAGPKASLVRDPAGNLYGTTENGGAFSKGTVFMLDTAGTLTVLHLFTGGTDGANPFAGLILDAAGNLYGTTVFGGAFFGGVVFKITP